MGVDDPLTIEAVRTAAGRLASALRTQHSVEAAQLLAVAVAFRGHPAEELLELRSAMVRTRPHWIELEDRDLAARAAAVLAEAKRLAIEM